MVSWRKTRGKRLSTWWEKTEVVLQKALSNGGSCWTYLGKEPNQTPFSIYMTSKCCVLSHHFPIFISFINRTLNLIRYTTLIKIFSTYSYFFYTHCMTCLIAQKHLSSDLHNSGTDEPCWFTFLFLPKWYYMYVLILNFIALYLLAIEWIKSYLKLFHSISHPLGWLLSEKRKQQMLARMCGEIGTLVHSLLVEM